MTGDHDHARPGRAAQQTVLDLGRAILVGNPPAASAAVSDAECPPCVAIAAMQYGFTLCSVFAGDDLFVSETTRRRLLAAIDATQKELDASAN